MHGLKTTSVMVQFLLTEIPETRNSDNRLYFEVIKMCCQEKGIDFNNLSFASAFNSKCFPKYETCRRSRQKIQEKYPELRADADVEAARMVEEEKFREFARS